jgi:hypothetical protein
MVKGVPYIASWGVVGEKCTGSALLLLTEGKTQRAIPLGSSLKFVQQVYRLPLSQLFSWLVEPHAEYVCIVQKYR